MADRTEGGPDGPDGAESGQLTGPGASPPPGYPPSPGWQPEQPPASPTSSTSPPPYPGGGGGYGPAPSGPGSYPPLPGGYGPPPSAPPGGGWGPGGYPGGGSYGYGYGYGSGSGYGYGPAPGGPAVPQEVYAGYWPRVGGWLIDAVVVWIVSFLVSIPLRTSNIASFTIRTHTGGVTRSGRFSILEAVAEVVIVLVYGALFCGSSRGQTPGMMAVGVRAVDRDTGSRIGFARALWRGVFEYILFIVLFVPWILDMLFPLWDIRHQTLHDKVSRTVVVKAALFPPGQGR